MVKTDFPRDGDFAPPTDYTDHSSLDTRERKELKKSTSKNLNDLNRELWGDFAKVTLLGTIKTFDKGYGLRIRDDNGDKIGTAYKWEQVRIFGRKKRVADSEGILRNFLRVGVYNSRGKIDEKRSGWVAEDFVEIDQEHINSLIQNLETKIDRQEKPEPPKPEVKKPEPPKPEVKKPEPPKPEVKKPEPPKPEVKKPEPPKPEVKKPEPPKPEVKKPEPPKPEVKKPEPPKPEVKKPEPPKPEVKKPEPVKPVAKPKEKKPDTPTVETPEKAPEAGSSIYMIQNRDSIGEISQNISISREETTEASKPNNGLPLYIGDPLAIPTIDRLTWTTPAKETASTPEKIGKPEVKKPEVHPTLEMKTEQVQENTVPVLSETDENTMKTIIWEYAWRMERHSRNPDTFNRTFPGRLNDHITLLNDLDISMDNAYFIDIGPGVADYQDQNGDIRADYPAITSREMAEAFPQTHVIAMDLPGSVKLLTAMRKDHKPIWEAVLSRDNVQIMAWDGMKWLRDQLQWSDILGNSLKIPGDNQTIIIRACNSIDIYYPFAEVKPVLEKMVSDFESQRLILLFWDRILHKPAGEKQLTIIGRISERGFNHNQQTTEHVSDSSPEYEIYDQYKPLLKK
jgi:hypothetical protein